MDDERIMHGMRTDEAYRVVRVLAERRGRVTELVTLGDAGSFIRKKMPLAQANRVVWATLPICACRRLPQVSTTYELPDTFVVVHSFVPGETVEARVREKRRLDAREAVAIALDVCEAAAALHAHGIIHCDISPANIVLAADGAHLIDLGAARMVTDPAPKRGERLGTLGFTAPERMLATPSAQSDVYSIGRVLAYLLTGADPAEDGFDDAFFGNATVPQPVREIVARACAFEASARYGSAEDLASALRVWSLNGDDEHLGQQFASGGAVFPNSAPPSAAIPAAVSAPSRDRRIIKFVLLALAVVMALCAAGIIVYQTAIAPSAASVARQTGEPDATDEMSDKPKDSLPFSSDTPDSLGVDGSAGAGNHRVSLELVETWWERGTDGLFQYAFGIKNTSSDMAVSFPEVTVTGKDAQGNIVSVDSSMGAEILPGQTQYFYGVGGVDGNPPAEVEFSVVDPSADNVAVAGGEPSVFEVSNVSTLDSGYGTTSVAGEITLVSRGADVLSYTSGSMVTVIARNADGAIVYAQVDFFSLPEEGETIPFQVDLYGAPEFADVDVYVMPW